MRYKQGELVNLIDPIVLPDGKTLPHPVLIVSNNVANSYESYYTGVMMTSTNYKDKFSFEVDDSMFQNPLRKSGSHLRLYLLISFRESSIAGTPINQIKPAHLKHVLHQIRELVFV